MCCMATQLLTACLLLLAELQSLQGRMVVTRQYCCPQSTTRTLTTTPVWPIEQPHFCWVGCWCPVWTAGQVPKWNRMSSWGENFREAGWKHSHYGMLPLPAYILHIFIARYCKRSFAQNSPFPNFVTSIAKFCMKPIFFCSSFKHRAL